MKKYIFITIMALIPLFYGCEYETLPTYSGADQIYFGYADVDAERHLVRNDSVVVKFGYDAVIKSDSVISIRVKVMGSVVDYNRPVNFILVDSTSTAHLGSDVELLTDQSSVPPGSTVGNIYVKLHNTENLNDTSLVASLRLIENEHFKADYHFTRYADINKDSIIVSTQIRIRFDNENEMPNMWANPATKMYFDMVFGPYSRVKFALMCQILPGCTREFFTYASGENPQTIFSNRFPMGLLAGWARGLNTYLVTYKSEHDGTPLYDENGNEVKSGTMFI